jgi:hypothetical protein
MARVYTVDRMSETWNGLDKSLHALYDELNLVIGKRAAWLFGSTLGDTEFLSRITGDDEIYPAYPLSDIEQDLVNFGTALVKNNGQVSDEIFDILIPCYTSKELVILVSFASQLTAANLFYKVFELTADDVDC